MQTNARTRHIDSYIDADIDADINIDIDIDLETDSQPGTVPGSRPGWSSRGGAFIISPSKRRPIERRVQVGVCPVCTCDEVQFDEVESGPRMKLAECPRCEHRWTTPVATRRMVPNRRRLTMVRAASVDAAAQA